MFVGSGFHYIDYLHVMCDEKLCENGTRDISGQIMRHIDYDEAEAHSECVKNQKRLSAESVSKGFVDYAQRHKGK